MPKVTVEFDAGNAAFEDDVTEYARVLTQASRYVITAHVRKKTDTFRLYDSNGNQVGTATYHHEED